MALVFMKANAGLDAHINLISFRKLLAFAAPSNRVSIESLQLALATVTCE